jgi:LCP family protein required for cell wall assembly
MGIPVLTPEELALVADTPLWYHVLREAEVRHNGERLGELGGRIVAEVLLGLLPGDPSSYLRMQPPGSRTAASPPPGRATSPSPTCSSSPPGRSRYRRRPELRGEVVGMSGWPGQRPPEGRGPAVAPGGRATAQLPPRLQVRPRRARWGRRLALALVVLLVLLLGVLVWIDLRLDRVDALSDYPGRPAVTPGTDWLVVGSDSRGGLSEQRRRELGTGEAAGRRADTMMLLHIPRGGGKPTLVSLPRDSYVPIPGRGRNKLNAAYAFGGPRLLARTVEEVTGIRVDHYMEVGFDGFASTVDAVGGVRICVKQRMRDPLAGIDLRPGCQQLDSRRALGYVRSRASARGDLDRVERQREFLGALVDKVTSPGVLLNPFRGLPLALRASDAIAVDNGDHIHHLLRFPFAMRAVSGGGGVATTVPVAGSETVPGAGSVVRWDRQGALALFDALKNDRPVPAG